jgi:hypothetical protein
MNVKRRRRRNFWGKRPDSKIFVKWQPRKCSENGAAGEIFNTCKKINKRSSNPGPPRAGPRAAAPPALRLIRAWILVKLNIGKMVIKWFKKMLEIVRIQ